MALCLLENFWFKTFIFGLSVFFVISPVIVWDISKKKERIKSVDKLTNTQKEYFKEISSKTWNYFSDFMTKENNYLPPDNYQESRREKIVPRTSSTNIGLGILAVVSAYDLEFIDLEHTIVYLENILETIKKLEKWNGHLYNWYNTRTLEPLVPRYISTVDSGNFVRLFVYFKRLFRRKIEYSVQRKTRSAFRDN